MLRRAKKYLPLIFLAAFLFSCTGDLTQLPPEIVIRGGKLTIQGQFCAQPPGDVELPVHILFIVDQSGSISVTDPDFCRDSGLPPPCNPGQQTNMRQEAMRGVWMQYFDNPSYDYGIIEYASTVYPTTAQPDGNIFVPAEDFEDYVATVLEPPTGSTTDMYSAIDTARYYIDEHLSNLAPEEKINHRYVIIFGTDGLPDDGEEPGVYPNGDPETETLEGITGIVDQTMNLKALHGAGDITFNTWYLRQFWFPPEEVSLAMELLDTMALVGNGRSLIFNFTGEPGDTTTISFEEYDLTSFVRTFALKSFVASNLSVRVDAGGFVIEDSDADGLPDEEDNAVRNYSTSFLQNSDTGPCIDFAEALLGTDPTIPDDDCSTDNPSALLDTDEDTCPDVLEEAVLRDIEDPLDCHITMFMDTDSDGCSDWVETQLSIETGATLDIANYNDCSPAILEDTDLDGCRDYVEISVGADSLDPFDCDCPPDKMVDRDYDGLRDCEEELLGIATTLFDDDKDGIPDNIEFHGGSNPHSMSEGFNDVDMDGIINNQEVREHTNPKASDGPERGLIIYEYDLTEDNSEGGDSIEGVYCYDFAVRNITLLNTLPDVQGRDGINRVVFSLIESAQDVDFLTNQGKIYTKELLIRYTADGSRFIIEDDGTETPIGSILEFTNDDIQLFDTTD